MSLDERDEADHRNVADASFAGAQGLHRSLVANRVRGWRRLLAIIDYAPDRRDDKCDDYGGDDQPRPRWPRGRVVSRRHEGYSDNVSIRSARPKSRSVRPPLLWVERTNRTLL